LFVDELNLEILFLLLYTEYIENKPSENKRSYL